LHNEFQVRRTSISPVCVNGIYSAREAEKGVPGMINIPAGENPDYALKGGKL
jgi:hypothetical protein